MIGSPKQSLPEGETEVDGPPAIEVALRLLAAREHSRYEMNRKLRSRGYDDDAIASALDRLQSEDLLSDQRFTRSLIEQRVRKGYGPLRIRSDLAERGVDSRLAGSLLDEADIDWAHALQAVAARRFGDGRDPLDHKALARRARQLVQRGFPGSLVRRYLEQFRAG
ncbi:MAG: regulatory protein RecX [Gammaproteobacteria bacterium]|nr:regulatory protein RecX [Gammaproteobacteria bacterium]